MCPFPVLFDYPPLRGVDESLLFLKSGSLAGTAEVEPVEEQQKPTAWSASKNPGAPPATRTAAAPSQVQRRPGRLALCNFGSWMVYDFHLHCQHFFAIDDKFLSCTRPISCEPQRVDPFDASTRDVEAREGWPEFQ